jgi:hypothetical protein
MKLRKFTATILCVSLLLTGVTGCSKKGSFKYEENCSWSDSSSPRRDIKLHKTKA